MIQIPMMSDDDVTVRTQITLTQNLRQMIDSEANRLGESLSEYLRRASIMRMEAEKKKKIDLKNLADRVIGSIDLKTHPHWSTKKKVYTWSRKIREEF